MRFSGRDTAFHIRVLTRLAVLVAILSFDLPLAVGQEPRQQQSPWLMLPKNDAVNAQLLARQVAALSPRVDGNEATLLADCAYATVSRLRREYHMFGTPIFNNFLIFHGLRKRGYCYHWTEDLLLALDALKLKTLELHWGETYPGTWRENNCVVVTAKRQPFERGMILECWRHLGHLRWNLVPSDEDRYSENSKYAQRIRSRAASKPPAATGHVAFQTRVAGQGKAGE